MSVKNVKTKILPVIQSKSNVSTFFRKAGEDSLFGIKSSQPFFKPSIQAKLSVSNPGDPQEKEADAVADKVMRMPDTVTVQKTEQELHRREEATKQTTQAPPEEKDIEATLEATQLNGAGIPSVQRSAENNRSNESVATSGETGGYILRRKNSPLHHSDILQQSGRGPPTTSIPFEQSLASSKGGGSALPDGTKQFMEHRFGADFSGVRVHTDPSAQQLSRSVNAQAFANGNDIYFDTGKFSPESTVGRGLLAHELTHTIQQGASPVITGIGRKISCTHVKSNGALSAFAPAPGSAIITRSAHINLFRKSSPENSTSDATELSNISGGYPLPSEARDYFQSSFKTDVGDIKIHTDFQATALCLSRHVPAFAQGEHIFFAPGRYSPESEDGGALLARQVSASLTNRGIAVPGMAAELSAGISEVKAGGGSAASTPKHLVSPHQHYLQKIKIKPER